MLDITCSVRTPNSVQELDQAIKRYLSSDLEGTDLFCQWQAICEASLKLNSSETEWDKVAGEDSY